MSDLETRLRRAAAAVAVDTQVPPLAPLTRRAQRRRVASVAAPVLTAAVVVAGVVLLRPDGPPPVSTAQNTEAVVAGVRVTLRLDRTDVELGQRVNAVATVTNERTTPVTFYGSSSCDTPRHQPGVDVDLRPGQPDGKSYSGAEKAFKEIALTTAPYTYSFGVHGQSTRFCTTDLRHWKLAVGESLGVEVWWVAETPFGSAYDGVADVRSRFTFADPDEVFHTVSATLPLHVRGGDTSRLSAADAVDAALADPRFAAFVDRYPPETWQTVNFRPGAVTMFEWYVDDQGVRVHEDAWQVRMKAHPKAAEGYVWVDPTSGAVVGRHLEGGG